MEATNCVIIGYEHLNYSGDCITNLVNDEQGNYMLVSHHLVFAMRCVEYNPELFCGLILPSHVVNPDIYGKETPHNISVKCRQIKNVPKAVSITVIPLQDMFFDIDNYETIFEDNLNKYFVLVEKQIIAMKIDEIDYTFEIANCVANDETKFVVNGINMTVVDLQHRDFVIQFAQIE